MDAACGPLNLVVHAMSGLNALLCILQTCGDFLQGGGTCFLVMWGGEEAAGRQIACTCRLFRHLARVVCFWCGVYPRIFVREGELGTHRPVEPGDRALYLICCLRDLMLLTDPRVHRDTHRWCQHCEL